LSRSVRWAMLKESSKLGTLPLLSPTGVACNAWALND
jgi:hypothetical protein